MEEVDTAAVDDAWELGRTFTQEVSNWGHAEHDLEVLTHLQDELVEEVLVSLARLVFSLGLCLQ